MILVVLIIAQLDMAQGIVERMNGLIASFTGQGVADHSALIRSDLRSLGFSTMLKHPMGIGIGCPHILALQYLSEDYYLHCNYAEIAAGGGFLGLIVFYSIYLHFAKLCYYLKKDSLAIILSALVIVMLLKDYGAVSYYYKDLRFSCSLGSQAHAIEGEIDWSQCHQTTMRSQRPTRGRRLGSLLS